MEDHVIYGIHIIREHVSDLQKILSEHGANIKTRLGLHDVSNNISSPSGLILLEIVGEEKERNELFEKLQKVKTVEVQKMIFKHEK
ncbi:hypothetical protein M0811_00381 [Anaeramoeba ignava]|uniref:Transcription factor NikR nickel binding C-terminal domain-containing protein n=1 Tax=Anaeramoeba ignava TaxID=1746090 RepID=A0A9Q0LP00_ANAIG|nr:hypothetical protein M0811_00381 [Anaeramoeba ignava]